MVAMSKGGSFEQPYETGVVGIHAGVMRTGKVILWSFDVVPPDVPGDPATLDGASRILDPDTGDLVTPPQSHHVFCAGQSFLPDGRLLVAGGCDDEVSTLHIFDPDSGEWSLVGTMAGWSDGTQAGDDVSVGGEPGGRWYPTCTALPDGRTLIMSGTTLSGGPVRDNSTDLAHVMNRTLEIFDPAAGLGATEELPVPFSPYFPDAVDTIDFYPFVYVLPDGRLAVHSRNTTRFYDLTDKWDPDRLFPTVRAKSRTYPGEGTSVLLPLLPDGDTPYRPRILIAGGGGADEQDAQPLTLKTPATGSAEILDLGDPDPAWRATNSLKHPRVMPDATLLPDGTVLVTGGSSVGMAGNKGDGATVPVMLPELFDPVAETWTTMNRMTVPRLYHSTAVLLPDARVLLVGTDGFFNPPPAADKPEYRAEIFSPPYLHTGPRPSISSAPATVRYGATFVVESPDADRVQKAALLRPGAATHSFNMDQRHVGLRILGKTGTQLTLEAPPSANIAPPGHYLLFIVDDKGVPSVAPFVAVGV